MVSLSLLSATYVPLTLDQIREGLDRAFPGVFLPPNERSFVVEGDELGGPHLIKSLAQDAQGLFLLHQQPGSLLDVSEEINEPELNRLLSSEHGWMSIDMIRAVTNDASAFRFVAKAMAQLAPLDAAFLLYPSEDAMAFDEKVRRLLAAGSDPLELAE